MPGNFHSPNYIEGSMVNGTSADPNGIPNVIQFDFGDLVNDISPNTTVQLQAVALVLNSEDLTNGLSLQVIPFFTYFNGTNTTTIPLAPVNITIIMAILTISKTNNISNMDFLMAGDVVEYTVTVSHTPQSTSAAFTVQVVDLFSPELTLIDGTVTAVPNANVDSGNHAGEATLLVSKSPSLALGEVLIVKYSVNLTTAILPNSVVLSVATAIWAPYPSAPEDILHNVSANATVKTASDGPLDLFVSATSLQETQDPLVNIGEVVTFTARVQVIEGTMTNTSLNITVPHNNNDVKLGILRAQVVSMDSSSSTLLSPGDFVAPTDSNNDGYNDTVNFIFGTLVNYGGSHLQYVSIDALVLDITDNSYPKELSCVAVFAYGNITNVFFTQTATATVSIVEPVLNISKTALTFGEPEAGGIVQYTVTAQHTAQSHSAAYDIVITDYLSDMHSLDVNQITITTPNATVHLGSGPILQVNISVFPLSPNPIVVIYNATLTVNVMVNQPVPNTAILDYYSATETEVCPTILPLNCAYFLPSIAYRITKVKTAIKTALLEQQSSWFLRAWTLG